MREAIRSFVVSLPMPIRIPAAIFLFFFGLLFYYVGKEQRVYGSTAKTLVIAAAFGILAGFFVACGIIVAFIR